MRIPCAVLVACALAVPTFAQGPIVPPAKTPPSQSQARDREVAVTVEGCVRGSRLKLDHKQPSLAASLIDASEFSLEGPKELLRQLQREHDGHQDEITGVAILPASNDDFDKVGTKEVGKKTRVVVGTSQSSSSGRTVPRSGPVRLRVQSLTHISNKCTV